MVKFQGKSQKISMGQKFYLNEEGYFLKGFTKGALTIYSERSKENVLLKRMPALKAPVK